MNTSNVKNDKIYIERVSWGGGLTRGSICAQVLPVSRGLQGEVPADSRLPIVLHQTGEHHGLSLIHI